MSTLFTKIIAWEIPSFKVYEDTYVYAFLDIFPQAPWHVLIVPKIEVDHFSDVPEPYYTAIFQAAKKLSKAIEKTTGCKRVIALFVGYEIPHCHYQLIPTNSMDDLVSHKNPQANADDLKKIQEQIIQNLL